MYDHKSGVSLFKVERFNLLKMKELRDECWWGTRTCAIINHDDQEAWYESVIKRKDIVPMIGSYKDNEVAVLIFDNIDWINRTSTFNAYVYPEHRNKITVAIGEAAIDFAFEILNLNKLNGNVIETNEPSLYATMKLGFKVEGRRRQNVYKCGKYLDEIMFGYLREEWEKCERVKDMGGTCNRNFNLPEKDVMEQLCRNSEN